VTGVTAHDPRAATNPLYSANRLKLGVFGLNVGKGCAMTTVPEALALDWPRNLALAQKADAAGFEALIPVGRYLGMGGPSNFNGDSYEVFCWAAGMAQGTRRSTVMATSNTLLMHPLVGAKQIATIDHISGGRFAMNVICGWYEKEIEMFGAAQMAHDDRYERADEWVRIVKRLWTADAPFDFDGRYYQLKQAVSTPQPLQKPFPPLMNAGGSPRGQHFSAKNCDIVFVLLNPHDLDDSRARIDSVRNLARDEYGRDIQVWTYGYSVQRDTQKDADDYLRHCVVEHGDDEAATNLLTSFGMNSATFTRDQLDEFAFHFKAGYGGYPLVGTPETIVDTLQGLSAIGLDGMAFSWIDYEDGLARFVAQAMPLMAQAGLHAGPGVAD
jgi:alkanesulfonate monooxygenase SsuD/methylene tetrahydromethanopterin reductase-like flavin-dependent oxidoreductase (luciferase family)